MGAFDDRIVEGEKGVLIVTLHEPIVMDDPLLPQPRTVEKLTIRKLNMGVMRRIKFDDEGKFNPFDAAAELTAPKGCFDEIANELDMDLVLEAAERQQGKFQRSKTSDS